jgi:hypothetical protein
MSKDGKPEDKGDHTDPFNPKNIKHLTSIDELPNDLHQNSHMGHGLCCVQ